MIKLNQFFSQLRQGTKNIGKLNVRYKEINIKQQSQLTYIGCALDEMSVEPMEHIK